MTGETPTFGFSRVVGHDDAKLALVLAAVSPAVGGVLLRGDKGAAKSTLARALAALLPGAAPFVELPLGATEDRLVGTIDLRGVLADGVTRFSPGLLAAAHGGVLYVDEVNLLPDHLVDVLLDVAASGVNRVEREGVSHSHPARFVLVGSMNPEEGELRPQLLDRFGLCVEVRSPTDLGNRTAAVRRRLEFDAAPVADPDDAALAHRVAAAGPAVVGDAAIEHASSLAVAVGAEGLRADLTLCRAAAALAGWEGRDEATPADVEHVAGLVLGHRARRRPFDPPSLSEEDLSSAISQAREASSDAPEPDDRAAPDAPGTDGDEDPGGGPAPEGPVSLGRPRDWSVDPPAPGARPGAARGRLVADRAAPPGGPSSVAVAATVRRVAERRATGGDGVDPGDVREAVRAEPLPTTLVVALDASGSMGAATRVEATTGAVLGLLADAYRRRHRVGVVSFRGEDARVDLEPTASVELARARLADLRTGGTTPLAAGVEAALALLDRAVPEGGHRPVIVLVTDGRATEPDDLDGAATALARARRRGTHVVVLDAETGRPRLGLAGRLAADAGAAHRHVDELTPDAVEATLRAATP